MTTIGPINLPAMTNMLEDYARRLKSQLPEDQQHIVEAILLAQEIRSEAIPVKTKIANLRGASIRFKTRSIMLSTMTDMLAKHLANPNLQTH